MTEEIHTIESCVFTRRAAVLFTGVVVRFVVFTCLPSELADKVTLSTAEVRLFINHNLLHTFIL